MAENATSFDNTAVSVGTTAVLLSRGSFNRKNLRVQNTHASQILYVGGTDQVTTSNGYRIGAGASETFENFDGNLYGIASGASTTVIVVGFS